MTQLTADNSNTQAISLTEFVDSVFVELHNKRKTEEKSVEYPNCWKDTLIPLFAKIDEMSQSDASVFWWLIQTMSRMDIFQDPRDFITRHVYDVLSTIKPSQSKIVLEHIKGVSEQDVKQLHDLSCNNNLDDFRKLLRANNYSSIFDVCRVLMRLQNVQVLFSKAASRGKDDSLAILFYFFRQCKKYFLNAYERYGRSCDGMMYNILLALDNTQYYVDNDFFCRLSKEIGGFLKQYIFFIHLTCQDVPNGIDQVICNVLNGTGEYDGLSIRYEDFDTNDQKIQFFEEKIVFLKPDDSKLLYQLMKENRQKIASPFWHLTAQKKKRKRISGSSSQNGSSPSIESSYYQLVKDDSIPVEKLSDISVNKLLISFIEDEENESTDEGSMGNYGKKSVAINTRTIDTDSPKSIKKIEPMWFPELLFDIAPVTKKLLLEVLHSKLVSAGFLANDSMNDFVFIFSGIEDEANVVHNAVDWKKERTSLQAFCSAFYDLPNSKGKKPWSKLTKLFTLSGQPIKKLSENANQVYGKDLESRMKGLIKSAKDDAKMKAQKSSQE